MKGRWIIPPQRVRDSVSERLRNAKITGLKCLMQDMNSCLSESLPLAIQIPKSWCIVMYTILILDRWANCPMQGELIQIFHLLLLGEEVKAGQEQVECGWGQAWKTRRSGGLRGGRRTGWEMKLAEILRYKPWVSRERQHSKWLWTYSISN